MNIKQLLEIDLEKCKPEAIEILKLATKYKIGHIASALSYVPVVDYVFDNIDFNTHQGKNTKVLIGKPHGALALYRNWLKNHWITKEDLDDLGSVFLASDLKRLKIPGVVYVANTLGNALGVCLGMSLSDPESNYVVILSDSSFLMGTTLEAVMQIKKFNPDNLKVIIDWNGWTSKEKMPLSFDEFHAMIASLNLLNIFTFFNNPKGYGVPEIEKEPNKWHY